MFLFDSNKKSKQQQKKVSWVGCGWNINSYNRVIISVADGSTFPARGNPESQDWTLLKQGLRGGRAPRCDQMLLFTGAVTSVEDYVQQQKKNMRALHARRVFGRLHKLMHPRWHRGRLPQLAQLAQRSTPRAAS